MHTTREPGPTTIFCVAPFQLPHIMPLYEQMAVQLDVAVSCAVVGPVPDSRLNLGWSELPPSSPHLQLWRRPTDNLRYLRRIVGADVVVFPGFFHYRSLPFHHWLRRMTGKPTILWSEPFLQAPRTATDPVSIMARRLLLAPCNTDKMNLLTMGDTAARDYATLGCDRWQSWRFGYSIQPPPADRDRQPPATDTPVRLLFCGALNRRKGVDILISALGTTALRGLDWHLTLLGDGPERQTLADQAHEAGIGDRLTFRGARPMAQCAEDYRRSDILVLPSRFDGWGAVINEAMEFGLAIIASEAVGAAQMLVEDGVNGTRFPAEDSSALAIDLQDLIRDHSRRRAMQQASRDKIVSFRPDEAARRLVALCRGLAQQADMPGYQSGLCSALRP